jgi:hypothetical protein
MRLALLMSAVLCGALLLASTRDGGRGAQDGPAIPPTKASQAPAAVGAHGESASRESTERRPHEAP